jgi:hypothetical protein
MEGRPTKTPRRKAPARTKRELITEVWSRLGRGSIGETELKEIQRSIRGQFGEGASESPAAIARVLADEGAELRHPEVIEFDASWRETKIEKDSGEFSGVEEFLTGRPLRLKKAEALIKRLETIRKTSETAGDQLALKQVRDMVINARRFAEALGEDRALGTAERAEQAELAEWLKVWLQTPNLFADWLELRRRAPDFRKKFSGG